GGADDDRARLRVDVALELLFAEGEQRRLQGQVSRLEARDQGGVQMVAVVRLEEEKPVAGIEERIDGRGEGAARAHRHADLRRRIRAEAVVALELARDRLAQLRRTLGERVGAAPFADGGDGAVADERRRGEIADPLAEIDAAHPFALAGHAADVGLDEALEPAGDPHGKRVYHSPPPAPRSQSW